MTRRPHITLVALIALSVLTCLGCESAPDASAESGSTCAYMSERNDAQCAGDPGGCPQDCLRGTDDTQQAALQASGCPGKGCTCEHKGSEQCVEARAKATAEGGHGCAASECPCPQKGEVGCPEAHADLGETDAVVAHPGCPYAQAKSNADPH